MFKYAYSDITVDNWAYIDVAFFTQCASYCNTLKFGIPYAEHPLCVYVYVCMGGEGERVRDVYCIKGNSCTETFQCAMSGWCCIWV